MNKCELINSYFHLIYVFDYKKNIIQRFYRRLKLLTQICKICFNSLNKH